MQKTTLQNLLQIFKGQSLTAILGALIFYFGSSYTDALAQIQKEVIEIKVELARINEKYAQKQQVRNMIDQAIDKHVNLLHAQKIKE